MDTATWWDSSSDSYHEFEVGLTHVNARAYPKQAEYESLIKAILCFARGLSLLESDDSGGNFEEYESDAVRDLICEASEKYLTEKFYETDAFSSLCDLSPLIYDVKKVKKAKRLNPEKPEREIVERNSFTHRLLREKTEKFYRTRNLENRKNVGAELGGLLYLIRCNMSHGHKMGSGGSSLDERNRDEKVTECGLRVLREIILKLLGDPQHRLAVYGTLRRGQVNYEQINDLGDPEVGSIVGEISIMNDYPVLTWNRNGKAIPVEVYSSKKLHKHRWNVLDAFETDMYRRMMVPVRLASGAYQVATVYVENRDD